MCRINAAILKYLEMHEGKVFSVSLGKLFKKCLENSQIQKAKYEYQRQDAAKSSPGLESAKENVWEEVKSCLNDVLNKVESDLGKSVVSDPSDQDKKTEKGILCILNVVFIYF